MHSRWQIPANDAAAYRRVVAGAMRKQPQRARHTAVCRPFARTCLLVTGSTLPTPAVAHRLAGSWLQTVARLRRAAGSPRIRTKTPISERTRKPTDELV